MSVSLSIQHVRQAMVQMVLDQRFFCLGYRLLYSLQLLRNLKARPTLLEHLNDAGKVTSSAPQALDDGRMSVMCVHGDRPCESGGILPPRLQ